ncbi:hypothetical protein BDZ90DRAFT_276805 [Jaminaea rosea]|uniref:Nucleosome assembly protein n=1 Tax=Jaminaea rosea TaxID=1569628 RepID=A0A316V002_9BASI|nr:hypothetical protein BDZ90DRAFT_276805 [Jaminaea rosea]PWN30338.1 hypothetical protein BDZ90DRAFT_276805 [Jaminaea rosea]
MSLQLVQNANEFPESSQKAIDSWKEDMAKADAEVLKLQEKLYAPLYEKRAEVISQIPDFWPKAIANCESLMPYFDDVDSPLITKIKNVKVTRPAEDPRGASITFEFHDNEFLAESSITKVFKPKADARPLGHEDFEWSEDLVPQTCSVKWTDDEHNLCKKKPTVEPKDEDDDNFEPGSFFSSFFESENPEIVNGIGQIIAQNFYPIAFDWYTGEAIGNYDDLDDFDVEDFDDEDEEDEEDDSEDDGAAEIDLDEKDGKPAAKKAKTQK